MPRLLDLYSCAGGAAFGYSLSGFDEIVGVDIESQPRYPFEFVQGDALKFLRSGGWRGFDAIHASPPCQAYTALRAIEKRAHPDLLAPTRAALEATGLPYVIENVVGAPMRRDYILCGSMFGLGAECRDGQYRQLRRHRWFETNWPVGLQPECQHEGQPIGVYGQGASDYRIPGSSWRGYQSTKAEAREALGIDWMSRLELSQSIPPAYTEFIGHELRARASRRAGTAGSR